MRLVQGDCRTEPSLQGGRVAGPGASPRSGRSPRLVSARLTEGGAVSSGGSLRWLDGIPGNLCASSRSGPSQASALTREAE